MSEESAESKEIGATPTMVPRPEPVVVAISTDHTVLARHLAAIVDNVFALITGVVAAKSINDNHPLLQGAALVVAYFGYYFAFEMFFGRTPGKLMTGLVVVGTDGARCTPRQTMMRTAFRFLEVNPAFLGALPAALSIVCSRHHQRFGDKWARTIVAPMNRVRPRKL